MGARRAQARLCARTIRPVSLMSTNPNPRFPNPVIPAKAGIRSIANILDLSESA